MRKIKNKTYKELFIDYINNFATIKSFANYYDMTISQANTAINIGRIQNNGKGGIPEFTMNNE